LAIWLPDRLVIRTTLAAPVQRCMVRERGVRSGARGRLRRCVRRPVRHGAVEHGLRGRPVGDEALVQPPVSAPRIAATLRGPPATPTARGVGNRSCSSVIPITRSSRLERKGAPASVNKRRHRSPTPPRPRTSSCSAVVNTLPLLASARRRVKCAAWIWAAGLPRPPQDLCDLRVADGRDRAHGVHHREQRGAPRRDADDVAGPDLGLDVERGGRTERAEKRLLVRGAGVHDHGLAQAEAPSRPSSSAGRCRWGRPP